MAISISGRAKYTCSSCKSHSGHTFWRAIDLVERPDLRAFLAEGTWAIITCPRCESATPRTEPLLVTRMNPAAPVLLALVDEQQDSEEAIERLQPMLLQVQHSLGAARYSTPGPIVPASFNALTVAAGRDLGLDVGDPGAADSMTADAGDYGRLLERIRGARDVRGVEFALDQLATVTDEAGLDRIIREHPVLLTAEARQAQAARADTAAHEIKHIQADARHRLLEQVARDQGDAAWAQYERTMQASWEALLERLERLQGEISEAGNRGDWSSLQSAAEEFVSAARSSGIVPLQVKALMDLGSVLLETRMENSGKSTERGVKCLEEAQDLIRQSPDDVPPELHVTVAAHLGVAYCTRTAGDPKASAQRAVDCLREALALTPKREKELRAIVHTNLGLALLELASESRQPQESLDKGASNAEADGCVEEAIKHFRRALKWRSFRRNPRDWAYTETNLGLAFFRRRSRHRERDLRRALEHYSNAVRGFEASGDDKLRAQVLHDISVATYELATLTDPDGDDDRSIGEAVAYAEASIAARPAAAAPIEAGRTWGQIGRMHQDRDSPEPAIVAYRQALETLTPTTSPRECRESARGLANLLSDRDSWPAAAGDWETAAVAAARAADLCATPEGRLKELHAHSDVFRLAGYALASAGRPERAVEIIELGRARELAAIMQDDVLDTEALAQLNPGLSGEFLELRSKLDSIGRAQVTNVRSGAESALTSERMSEVIDHIRTLPGFEGFLEASSFAQIAETVEPSEGLAYLVSSPVGTTALLLGDASDGPHVTTIQSDQTDAGRIVRIILDVDEQAQTIRGYAYAQSVGDTVELERSLFDLSAALGPSILQPLSQAARSSGLTKICLVTTGLLGLLPLHALQWNTGGGSQCLLDEMEVVYAPSALSRRVCRKRAAERDDRPRRVLAVGNPLPQKPPLPGAEREARMVAELFDPAEAELLVGTAATKTAILAALPTATHVHLACHGSASWPEDILSAHLLAAHGEPITARELLALRDFEPQLIVASACQTGVLQGYDTADQALSLGTAFLGAGAAEAVATLWPVDDYATALLMSRFYETLLEGRVDGHVASKAVSTALREAALWLRDLTPVDEGEYLKQRPTLRAHRDWSRSRGGGRRSGSGAHPYGSMSEWAPFLLFGS